MPPPSAPAPTARPRDPWSLALVAVAVVWVLGSVVNVAYQVGVAGRSAWWLLEVPLSAAVADLVGMGAWRRLRVTACQSGSAADAAGTVATPDKET